MDDGVDKKPPLGRLTAIVSFLGPVHNEHAHSNPQLRMRSLRFFDGKNTSM